MWFLNSTQRKLDDPRLFGVGNLRFFDQNLIGLQFPTDRVSKHCLFRFSLGTRDMTYIYIVIMYIHVYTIYTKYVESESLFLKTLQSWEFFFCVNFEPVSMPPCRAVSVSTHAWQRPSGRMVVLGSFLPPENGDLKSTNGSLSSKNDDLSIKDCDLTVDVQFLGMWMDLPWVYQELMGR